MAISISGAKQEETKKRRLAKVTTVLKTGAQWTGEWNSAEEICAV
jgi:hypothetical protein